MSAIFLEYHGETLGGTCEENPCRIPEGNHKTIPRENYDGISNEISGAPREIPGRIPRETFKYITIEVSKII